MLSRIAPSLRSRSPLSPEGPRAARFGRDGARGCESLNYRRLLAEIGVGDGLLFHLGQAASRRVSPKGGDREEPVWQPRDRRLEWRLSTAVRCGQHGCPRADAGRTARHANQWGANRSPTIWRAAHALTPITPAHHPSAPGHADFIAQKSNVGPLSEKHVGQGGAG